MFIISKRKYIWNDSKRKFEKYWFIFVFSTFPNGGLALLEARTPAATLMVKYNPLLSINTYVHIWHFFSFLTNYCRKLNLIGAIV